MLLDWGGNSKGSDTKQSKHRVQEVAATRGLLARQHGTQKVWSTPGRILM